ncbi:proton-conducting transporter membrane subunit [Devosia sp. A8/3-2]|nr:proton-conducting transporter membrane subunit [Devosia sp. A8/3-2]
MIETPTALADWVIVLPLVLALLGAALLLMLRQIRRMPALLAGLVVIAIIACEVALLQRIAVEGPLSMTMGKWLPPFGISFTADIFGAAFALAAAFVTLIVIIYAEGERGADERGDGFHALVLLLLAGVTGAFLTGDLFNLYVWFEVMLIASFGLIVTGGRPLQLDGAVKYGFLNFLATTLFLLSLGLIYGLLGTLNMADIIGKASTANPAALTGIAALLLLAFGMKAAAFPLNARLPASYHTPPTVISALFAGLLTKVGVYALLRAGAALAGEPGYSGTGFAIGRHRDVADCPAGGDCGDQFAPGHRLPGDRGIGAVLAGIALPSEGGVAGAALYVFHAILTMTALYLVAGLIERRTGQRDTVQMGGLYAASTPLSVLFLVLVLATAGVPPFLGFWPKLLLLDAGVQQAMAGDWADGALVVALLANAVLTLIAGSRLWAHVFWRSGVEGAVSEHETVTLRTPGVREQWLGLGASVVLTALIVLAGLWPNLLFEGARAGAADLVDPARYIAAFGLAEATP